MKLPQRRYEAHEIRDLSEEEFAELRESGLTRQAWDAMRKRTAYGSLCAALVHLREAEAWFGRIDAPLGATIHRLAEDLSGLTPSYLELPGSDGKAER